MIIKIIIFKMITNNELFRNTNKMYDRNVIEIHCHNMRVNVS